MEALEGATASLRDPVVTIKLCSRSALAMSHRSSRTLFNPICDQFKVSKNQMTSATHHEVPVQRYCNVARYSFVCKCSLVNDPRPDEINNSLVSSAILFVKCLLENGHLSFGFARFKTLVKLGYLRRTS